MMGRRGRAAGVSAAPLRAAWYVLLVAIGALAYGVSELVAELFSGSDAGYPDDQ